MADLQFCIAERPRFVVEINMGLLGRPTAHKFDWCEGRKMDEDCLGWVVRRPGEAAVLCYICMKCFGSEKAAPVWIEIQTQSAY